MDLYDYIDYHYVNTDPEWVKKAKGLEPRPLSEILIDLFLRIILIVLVTATFYMGTRVVGIFWRRYIQRKNLRELRNLGNFGEAGAGANVVDHPHED